MGRLREGPRHVARQPPPCLAGKESGDGRRGPKDMAFNGVRDRVDGRGCRAGIRVRGSMMSPDRFAHLQGP